MHKEVKPVEGEPLRYWVESSEETPHFVDLSEFDGNGECSCNNFKYRCRAHMKEYGRIVNHGFPNATRCKHINTAMMYMADTIIYQFNENQKKQFGYVRANGSNDPEVERLRYGAQRQVQLPGDRREPAAESNSNGGEQPEYDWTQG